MRLKQVSKSFFIILTADRQHSVISVSRVQATMHASRILELMRLKQVSKSILSF